MPQQILRFGGQLMEQQLWCWGRDVERVEGNLLMEFGFERHRECEIDPQSTCYRLDCDELHVCLWGFGMFFGRRDLGGSLSTVSTSGQAGLRLSHSLRESTGRKNYRRSRDHEEGPSGCVLENSGLDY